MSNENDSGEGGFWSPAAPPPPSQPQQATSNSFFPLGQAAAAASGHYGLPAPGNNNFTVLSDAFGNFYKVYHTASGNAAPEQAADVALNNGVENPPIKCEYELFSSSNNSSFIRPVQGFGFLFHQQQQQQAAAQQQAATPESSGGTGSGTSMLINQLVGNWAPTISGTYSPFGSGAPSLLAEGLPRSSETYAAEPTPAPPTPVAPVQQSPVRQPVVPTPPTPEHKPAASASPTASYNQLNDEKSAKLNANVRKQRIVAEVKPMRMSYSDVLSKNAAAAAAATAPTSSGPVTAGNGTAKAPSATRSQAAKVPQKKSAEFGGKKVDRPSQKKVTTPNVASSQPEATFKPVVIQNGGSNSAAKKADKSNSSKANATKTSGGNGSRGKNRLRNFSDASYTVQDVQRPSGKEASNDEDDDGDGETNSDEDYDREEEQHAQSHQQIYNVKKNNVNPNDTHIEKIFASRSTGYKRGGNRGASRAKQDKSYQASSSVNSSGKRGNQRPRKNQKYVIVQKILNAWLEYTVLAVLWLWSLVSDVVYLSLRLAWDYLVAAFQYCEQNFTSWRRELQQDHPGTWLRNAWKSFDSRFASDSKWALWRGKKKPEDPATTSSNNSKNYYKDGRLPSTADEAMSSLLNCKGKDAYAILGVAPDCAQEQIRKHYKKIAVLVHPDKNKQPGAEEAFKVLQRSFELIGEPENRQTYDQSLAEVLNAEKAWSEINDLLTQLHTKISEAANTIRCSSCCLRHPRKPTGRPHYAARECNSCKIRHSAREGDIWAETSCFGLRWKYLAMMEGNVYDITDWANCQKGALSHLQPNSHIVQYRIVLGGNSQQGQQSSQQQNQQGGQQQQHVGGGGSGGIGGGGGPGGSQSDKDAGRGRKEGEPNLDDFLNNIYGGQNQQQQQQQGGSRRRHRRN
uniref:Putative molecular chaperone dnaj superfamily protein n=1 Tax=Culex tarsalis TaxID=7177 RepID=A0A1Q3F4Z5_CULTA